MTMANGCESATVAALAPFAPARGSIRTCPTSMDGATPVEDNVTERTSVDVVWCGDRTGNTFVPTRRSTGDGGGRLFAHHWFATRASWASARDGRGSRHTHRPLSVRLCGALAPTTRTETRGA